MKKTKKISLIVIVSIIAVIFLVMFLTSTLYSCTRTVDKLPTDFESMRPEGVALELGDLTGMSGQEKKDLALSLYEKAEELDQKALYRMFYSSCSSISTNSILGEMKVDLFIHEFKNPSKYYKTAYRIPQNALPGLSLFFEFETAERTYHDNSLPNYARYEKVTNARIGDKLYPVADWRSAKKKEIPVPYYNGNQPVEYQKSEHNITEETVDYADVTRNEDGTISLLFLLDVENPITTIRSKPAIVAGSQAEDAHFTEVLLEFILWDNGYFKGSVLNESWEANTPMAGGVFISNVFEYHEKYSYEKDICNIEKLSEVKEMQYR